MRTLVVVLAFLVAGLPALADDCSIFPGGVNPAAVCGPPLTRTGLKNCQPCADNWNTDSYIPLVDYVNAHSCDGLSCSLLVGSGKTFSAATATSSKPWPTGSTLPATCTLGDTFQTPAGVFNCVATNDFDPLSASGSTSTSTTTTTTGSTTSTVAPGDITAVGPCTTGACFTDGVATPAGTAGIIPIIIWEGVTVNTKEFRFYVPDDPVLMPELIQQACVGSDCQIYLPSRGGVNTIATTDNPETFTNKTIDGGVATTTHAAGANFLKAVRHATDCTAVTDGKVGEFCLELDDKKLYLCIPTAGDCSGAEWNLIIDLP